MGFWYENTTKIDQKQKQKFDNSLYESEQTHF